MCASIEAGVRKRERLEERSESIIVFRFLRVVVFLLSKELVVVVFYVVFYVVEKKGRRRW